jgi:hypothetical protein
MGTPPRVGVERGSMRVRRDGCWLDAEGEGGLRGREATVCGERDAWRPGRVTGTRPPSHVAAATSAFSFKARRTWPKAASVVSRSSEVYFVQVMKWLPRKALTPLFVMARWAT